MIDITYIKIIFYFLLFFHKIYLNYSDETTVFPYKYVEMFYHYIIFIIIRKK